MPDSSNMFRDAREALEKSQEYVARKCDVSVNTVRNWETDRSTPAASKLQTLCDVLKLDPADVVEWLGRRQVSAA